MDNWACGKPVVGANIVDNRNLDFFTRGQPITAQALVNTNPTPTYPAITNKVFVNGVGRWVAFMEIDNRSLDYFYVGQPAIPKKLKLAYISGSVLRGTIPVVNAKVVCLPEDHKGVLGTTYTDVDGNYRFDVTPDRKYCLFIEYEINGQKYNSYNHWNITPEED